MGFLSEWKAAGAKTKRNAFLIFGFVFGVIAFWQVFLLDAASAAVAVAVAAVCSVRQKCAPESYYDHMISNPSPHPVCILLFYHSTGLFFTNSALHEAGIEYPSTQQDVSLTSECRAPQ